MHSGGVSKSMSSLMNVINRERYDVSLMIVNPSGPFMKLLPKDLRLITNPVWEALTERTTGFWKLIKLGHPLLALGHFVRLAISQISKARAGEMIAAMMPAIDEEFDTIVDFNGQQQCYYMVKKLKARKKISFFHNDYSKWPYYYKADRKYFPRLHSLWSISEQCVNSLKQWFPNVSDKIFMMENISSGTLIERLAQEEPKIEFSKNVPSILTVGHLCERKGSHWALEAASILKKKSIEFQWYFLGHNTNPTYYTNLCKELNIEDCITFLEVTPNPYPYIKNAMIIAHPSQYEGKSIALDEAKILCKPIVVTNFSTVSDQFTNQYNASICEMKPEAIANAIVELLTNKPLQEKYSANLAIDRKDNSEEIEKLYAIFDD